MHNWVSATYKRQTTSHTVCTLLWQCQRSQLRGYSKFSTFPGWISGWHWQASGTRPSLEAKPAELFCQQTQVAPFLLCKRGFTVFNLSDLSQISWLISRLCNVHTMHISGCNSSWILVAQDQVSQGSARSVPGPIKRGFVGLLTDILMRMLKDC